MSQRIVIEIMTKKDCCLCDEAKEVIQKVLKKFPAELKSTDIETDPGLFEAYKEKIPVVFINGEQSFMYKVHPVTLQKKLELLME